MKAELERIIAKIEELETRELTDDERRLLAEAKSRLILLWQGREG